MLERHVFGLVQPVQCFVTLVVHIGL